MAKLEFKRGLTYGAIYQRLGCDRKDLQRRRRPQRLPKDGLKSRAFVAVLHVADWLLV